MKTSQKRGWIILGAMIAVLQAGVTWDVQASENLQEPDVWVSPRTTQAMPEERALRDEKKRLRSDAGRIRRHRRVDLASPSEQEIQSKMTQRDRGPTKIGFSRDLPGFGTQEQTRAELDWQRVDDGGMTTLLTFDSVGAAAVRLGIRVTRLPANAEFRFFPDNPGEADMVTATDILAAIERNVAAGDPDHLARTYWSPVISGENISLEIYLPPNTPADEVDIAIPSLTHLMVSPTGSQDNLNARAAGIRASGSCNNDVSCDVNWADRSNAVARMIFTSGTYSYLCSGTLLNDATNTGTPYFLTANHCISTQSEASSLNTYWFYRSAACNSGILNASYRTLATGAALLYQSANTDTSFLRLNSAPPGGVTFAGWTTAAPTITAAATGIHHPSGDLQKISYGSLTGFLNCTAPTSTGSFSCSSSSTGNYANIRYTSGTTEGGSSGSGVFLNGGQYLFGQLYGGSSSCTNLGGSNTYGRFDKAYAAGNLGQWLNAGGTTYAVTLNKTGTGTVTSAPSGISCGSGCTGPSAQSAQFTPGVTVTLTATPGTGYTFSSAGWICPGTLDASNRCVVTMDADKTISATFAAAPINYRLSLSKGSATSARYGSVTSNPGGINCGTTCRTQNALFAGNTTVTLTAQPLATRRVRSWSGCASSTISAARGAPASCTVNMTAARSVTANFQ